MAYVRIYKGITHLKHTLISGVAVAMAAMLQCLPAAAQTLPPVRIILVGDSTMARKSGYGDAFCAEFKPEVTCVNHGRGGRSTKSYRVEGLWDKDILPELKTTTTADGRLYAKTYLLMQFGHNDGSPKPERHTDVLWEYPANLSNYAKDVKATGAEFILVTPLSQRNFVKGHLLPDRIAPFAASMHNVAITDDLPLLDLFAESQKAVQAMGLVKANHTLAGTPIPKNVLDTEATGTSVPPEAETDASQVQGNAPQKFDYTHLNQTTGAALFGTMVADLLTRQQPGLAAYRKAK